MKEKRLSVTVNEDGGIKSVFVDDIEFVRNLNRVSIQRGLSLIDREIELMADRLRGETTTVVISERAVEKKIMCDTCGLHWYLLPSAEVNYCPHCGRKVIDGRLDR